jgi:hypothetical protein
MGGHDPSLGHLRREFAEALADVLVGQAMEAVAAHAFLVQPLRDREAIGYLRMAPMEGRIEAGHLKQVWLPLQDCADRGQVVGLMQGRQRHEALQMLDDFRGDNSGVAEIGTAVHHTMPHRDGQSATYLLSQECNDLVERGGHAADFGDGVGSIYQRAPLGILGHQSRARADTVNLALHAPLDTSTVHNREQLELDARAACVGD